tara:strand:- start:2074 stop:3354 length:1281 start_codon:yes stop_codon:yes gene_type:complete
LYRIKKKIGIIGLGYVGLPFLHLLSKKKIDVYGFDLDNFKINSIKKNLSYISDLKNKDLKIINKKKILSMKEISQIYKVDYIIFCLPTPLTSKNEPDISVILKAFNSIKPYLKKNQTLILESTVYPGATRYIFHKYLEKKFTLGKNFFYGYSSERISPGQINKIEYKYFLYNTTKVVSGYDDNSLNKINLLYKYVFKDVYSAQSLEIAEMSKLVENSYRSVNIGLVNEIKKICFSLNINFNQVLDTAATKPFGFNLFRPGPGVGGHCIPIDPIFITWIAKKNKQKAKFIELAREINIQITNWILKKICKLNKKTNDKKHKLKILIIGLAYKADVNDLRESPAIKIFKYFENYNNKIDFYDPLVKKAKIGEKYHFSKKLNKNLKYDFSVICTDHSNLNKKIILSVSKKIFDTRGIFKNLNLKKIVQL